MNDMSAPAAITQERLLKALQDARQRLLDEDQRRHEPVAIVGVGGRLPGADDPGALWNLLRDSKCVIAPISAERDALVGGAWARASTAARHGGFLQDIQGFDHRLFGISPAEAQAMDPQHRLLLQAAWAALEDACIDPGALRQSATGVWIGISNSDYAQSTLRRDPQQADAYTVTGSGLSLAAGRLSYLLGLRGPALAVDTACSSSLVALHLALQSLRSGETDLALVGGVQLLLEPDVAMGLDRMGALSPTGQCRAFDAGADGFVRGEGALCMVLARASDPRASRVRPRAWVLGSAVNQDGPSTGLTAPNGRAQADVIRAALEAARVQPQEVDLIEAHGTGTPLGDPIELRALESVFVGRSRPLPVGSVKSNIGHLEACAGLAGVLKVLLCLEQQQVPAQPGLDMPSPHIDWAQSALQLPRAAMPWPARATRRVAGVSSFGFSGTNAHVVLADAAAAPELAANPGAPAPQGPWLIPVSARTAPAADALLEEWARTLGAPGVDLDALARTAQHGRAHFEHRRALVVHADAKAQKSGSDAGDRQQPTLLIRRVLPLADTTTARCVWLFTGQGSAWLGMGRALYAAQPLFRQAFDELADQLAQQLPDKPLRTWLLQADETTLQRTEVQQPLVVALSCALASVWRAWGVKPSAVIGHSVGELAAAAAAGFLAPGEAVRLAALRGQLMQSLPEGGGMLALGATVEQTQALIAEVQRAIGPGAAASSLTLAGLNAPQAQTVAGALPALEAMFERAQAQGLRVRRLAVSHPFHSAWMTPVLSTWSEALRGVIWAPGDVAMVSSSSGQRLSAEQVSRADYWVQQAVEPVRFEAAVRTVWAEGPATLLELGPSGGLAALVGDIVGEPVAAVGSLQTGQDDTLQMLHAAAVLHAQGISLKWEALSPLDGTRMRAPGYRFEATPWWLHRDGPMTAGQPGRVGHPPLNAGAHAGVQPEAAAGREAVPVWREWQAGTEPERTERIRVRLREIVAHVGGPGPNDSFDEDENFFSLGLDSITLVQAGGMISRTFGVKMDLGRFYDDASTLHRLANWLAQALDRQAAQDDSPTIPSATGAFESAPPSTQSPPPAGPGTATTSSAEAVPDSAPRSNAVLPNRPGRAVTADVAQRQRAYLAAFAPRYVKATAGSREHVARHRPHLATGRNLAGFRADWKEIVYQIVGGEGRGARLRDVDGREYVDFTMGFGVCLFGHAPGFVNEALQREIARGMPLGPLSDLAGQAAEQLTALTGTDRVAFFNTGSDAVMNALRIARTVRQRNRIVLFEGAYHGTFDGVLALQLEGRSLPIAPGTPGAMVEDVTVLRYGDASALDEIERLAPELAAVLVEPVQSRHPELQPQAFLRRLRALTQRLDVPLVLDEMITGFRCHPGGIQKRWGIEADLVTYGKILGGGTPIGAVAGRARYMDAVDGGAWTYGDGSLPQAATTFTSGTFCNHPLGMAAAQAVLSELQRRGPSLQDELDRRTAEMCNRLNRAYEREGFPLKMVWFSSLFRFQFGSDLELLFPHLIERGYYVWEGRNCFISSAHTQSEIDGLVDAVMDSLRAMRRGGLLAEPPGAAPTASGPRQIGGTRAPRAPVVLHQAPATPPQARVLWSQELHVQEGLTAQAAYVLTDARVVAVPLDERRLRSAWKALIERHEALRTGLHRQAEAWQQRVLSDAPAHLEWMEMPEVAAAQVLQAEPAAFDLGEPPLARLRVLQISQPDGHRQVVQLQAHHAVVDGLSFAVMLQDLWALYAGERLPPAPGPVQASQAPDNAASERRIAARVHWEQVFATPLRTASLPLDRPHGTSMRYAGASVERVLGEDTIQGVRELARTQKVTVYAVLLTAWASLMARLSQAADCVIGVPASVRPLPHLAGSLGMFVATLPLRLHLPAALPATQALQRTAQALLGAVQHAEHPIEDIIEHLNLPGRRGRHPLLDTMFEFEVQDNEDPQVDGQALRSLNLPARHALFDLDVEAILRHGRLQLSARFRLEVYDEATVQAWMQAYADLLSALVQNPHRPLGDLPVAPAPPRAPQGPMPDDRCLHGAALSRLARHPHAVVLRTQGRSLTGAELDAMARACAQALRRQGLKAEQPVALLLQRSPAAVAAWLAVLACGGCVVPLDPDQPLARQADLLNELAQVHAAGVLLLTDDPHSATELQHHAAAVLMADETLVRSEPPPPWTQLAPNTPEPQQLAYLLFTSGSTGKPKAVAVSHEAAACHVHWYVQRLGLSPDDAVLHKTVCTFDTALSELFGALCSGATLVLPGPQEHLDFAALADCVVDERVTVIEDVPSLAPLLLEQPRLAEARSLRWYNPGGEALSAELAQRLVDLTGARVLNLYGPTEAAVDAVSQEWDGTAVQGHVPIGRAVDRVVARVLDERMQPVALGGCGELYLGGEQLARGYAGRPDLTAERFVPDLHGEPGQRLYRTGDQVRLLPDGRMLYLGRGDAQVKIRGQRVEPGEVEAQLRTHPAVVQAVVKAWPDAQAGWVLVAYVQPAVPADLRTHLQARLPRAWIPSQFAAVDAWPLLPNGKLDRSALARPPSNCSEAARGAADHGPSTQEQSVTPLTACVLRAFESALGLQSLTPNDDFFALGGHSLSAVRAVAELKRQLGVPLRVRLLFEHPRADSLAQALSLQLGDAPRSETSPPPPTPNPKADTKATHAPNALPLTAPAPFAAEARTWPLSPAQRGVWLACQLSEDPAGYNMAEAYLVQGVVPATALRAALQQVQRAHPALRTGFVVMQGEVLQCVHEDAALPWLDPGHGGVTTLAHAQNTFDEVARRAFDLHQAPLMRVVHAVLDTGSTFIGLVVHHLVFDGWSVDVLVQALGRALDGLPLPSPDSAAPPPAPPPLSAPQRQELLDHWSRLLSPRDERPEWFPDTPRAQVRSLSGSRIVQALSPTLEEDLRIAAAQGLTLTHLSAAAALLLVHLQTGYAQPSIGLIHAGRDDESTQPQIGLFVNTLVLGLPLQADEKADSGTAFEWLTRVRKAVVEALDHSGIHYTELVSALSPQRHAGRQPWFDLALNVLEGELAGAGLEQVWNGAQAQRLEQPVVDAKFDLTLTLERTALDPVRLSLEYAHSFCNAVQAQAMAEQFAQLLAAAARAAASWASAATTEAQHWNPPLERWLNATLPAPMFTPHEGVLPPQDLWELFDAAAHRTPNSIALRQADGRSLSYGELRRHALAVAQALYEAGVCAGDHCGLLMPHGAAFLAAVLGVMHRGAVYVPLDPHYPATRLAEMANWARLKCVLSERDNPAWHDGPTLNVAAVVAGLPPEIGPPRRRVPPQAPAYLMFTSGSTGRPKGVWVPQQGVIRLVSDHRFAALPEGATVGWASSLSFDASTLELWSALTQGAALAEMPRAELLDPPSLRRFIEHQPLDLLWLTAGLFHATARVEPAAFGSVRRLMVGGDRIEPSAVSAVLGSGRAPGELLNGYGPTENTTFTTVWKLDPSQEAQWRGALPIGSPVAYTRVSVLGPGGRAVPDGLAGELGTSGLGLALGYWGAPDLTAERFVPDPDGPPGSRRYLTGDLVRVRSDGNIDFLGRRDRQVKIRGHRIEPREIEVLLRAQSGVQDSCVLVQGDRAEDRRLVAFILSDEADAASTAGSALRSQLPSHLVPARLMALRAWPLNANGKVDTSRLLQLLHDEPEEPQATTDSGACSEQAAALLQSWQRVLGRAVGSVDDNFFALGGDSIMAIQVAASLSAQGWTLRAHELFEAPTIRELAPRLKAMGSSSIGLRDHAGPLNPWPIVRWFNERALPGAAHFCQAVALEVQEPANRPWTEILEVLIARHAAFRLRLHPDGGLSLIDGDEAQLLHFEDGAAFEGAESVRRLALKLNAETGPMMAAAWCPKGEDRSNGVLLLVAHHLAVDGVSWRLLASDLEILMQGGEPGPPAEGLRAWAAWCEQRAAELQRDASERNHWLAVAAVPGLIRPDQPQAPNRAVDAVSHIWTFNADRSQRLAQGLIGRGWGWDVLVLAALARALRFDAPALRLDLESHGRGGDVAAPDLSRVVGWFTSLYPVALEPLNTADILAWLEAAALALRRVPGQGLGWGLLRHGLQDEAFRSAAPASVLLNHLGDTDAPTAKLRSLVIAGGEGEQAQDSRSHDIEVSSEVRHQALHVSWTLARPRYGQARAQRWIDEFARSVELAEAALCLPNGWNPSIEEEDLPIPE